MDDHSAQEPRDRLVLSPQDLERISEAVSAGLTRGRPSPRRLIGEVTALLILTLAGFAFYLGLNHWRPPVDPSIHANGLPSVEVLTHTPEDQTVSLEVGAGQVQALTVEELTSGHVTVTLPREVGGCRQVADKLDGVCAAGVVEVHPPVTVQWNSAQTLYPAPPSQSRPDDATRSTAQQVPESMPQEASQLQMTLQRPAQPQPVTETESSETETLTGEAPLQVTIATWNGSAPSQALSDVPAVAAVAARSGPEWCFGHQRSTPSTLSVSQGTTKFDKDLEATGGSADECEGLAVRIRASEVPLQGKDASRAASVITLAGISSLDITTVSRHLEATALTGTVNLGDDVRVIDNSTRAVFTSESAIESQLQVRAGAPSLSIEGEDVTSIETDEGNLVTTEWNRRHDLYPALLIGFVGVLAPLLGAAYKNGVDCLDRFVNGKAAPRRT